MVLRFLKSYNAITLAVILAAASPCAALAQEYSPGQAAAALQGSQLISTPEKRRKWMRDKFHVVQSRQWPSNFPVPVYTSNVVETNFSNSTKGQPRAAASLITKDAPAQVFDFYQSALSRAKWTVRVPSAKARGEMNVGSEFYFLTAEQGKQSIYLTCAANRKTNATFVNISWQKNL